MITQSSQLYHAIPATVRNSAIVDYFYAEYFYAEEVGIDGIIRRFFAYYVISSFGSPESTEATRIIFGGCLPRTP